MSGPRWIPAALAIMLAITGIALAWVSAGARAGTIRVWSCHQPSGAAAPLDRWSSNVSHAGIDAYDNCANTTGFDAGVFGVSGNNGAYPAGQSGSWTFAAPPGTRVTSLAYERVASLGPQGGFYLFKGQSPIRDQSHIEEACATTSGCSLLNWSTQTIPIGDADGLLIFVEPCSLAGGCSASWGFFQVQKTAIDLVDSAPPSATSLTGSLASSQALSGNASLAFQASDVGTGVYKLHVTVDGVAREDRVLNANDGRCQPVAGPREFVYAVPCPLSTSAVTQLDTTTLSDGPHSLVVAIEDAAGNMSTVLASDVEIRNAQPQAAVTPSTGTPADTGTPAGGNQDGRPATIPSPVCNPACSRSYRSAVITGSKRTLRSKYGQGFAMSFALRLPDGTPIPGATVQIVETVSQPRAKARIVATTKTDRRGRAIYRSSTRFVPSATYRAVYSAQLPASSASAVPTAFDAAFRTTHVVASRLTFAAGPRRARVGSVLRLAGQVKASLFPKRGLVIRYEALQAGGKGAGRTRWTQFHAARTNRNGRYASRYQLRGSNLPSRLTIRACVEKDSDWPYQASCSRSYRIRVTR